VDELPLAARPGSYAEKQLKLLAEMLESQPEAQALREQLTRNLEARGKSLPPGSCSFIFIY